LFGNILFRPHRVNVILPMVGYRPHAIAAILAMSGYRVPEIIHRIATDRSTPYVHRELKRTRHRIRYSDVRNAPVYKYLSMRQEYAVGSTQGGVFEPVQQHTWEVLWATKDPLEGFNVLFTIHPYVGGRELGMYFPEEPQLLTQAVVKGDKPTFERPDKWTGSSPYEQVFQHEDTVIALYDVPEGTDFPHISAYFSRTLRHRHTDESGWIFAQGGEVLLAYFPLAPYEWRSEDGGDWRLHSPHLKNGAILQVAPAGAFPSLDVFGSAVRALPLETATEPFPQARFTTLKGRQLEAAYGAAPRVDGVQIDYAAWPLFDGPFLHAEKGSRRLEMRHGRLRRLLDFEALTIKDWGEE
jgi:hypothetical protein